VSDRGAGGDAACLHRAAARAYLSQPDPEPPAHGAYAPQAEALQRAQNDLERAYRDLDRYNDKLAQDLSLTEAEYRGSLSAQERQHDASERIAELTAKVQVAA